MLGSESEQRIASKVGEQEEGADTLKDVLFVTLRIRRRALPLRRMLSLSSCQRLWRSSATAIGPSPLTATLTQAQGPALEAHNRRQLHLPASALRSLGWGAQDCPLTKQRSPARWAQPNTHLCLVKRPRTGCTASAALGRPKVASVGAHRPHSQSGFGGGSRPLQLQQGTMAPLAAASFAEPETYAEQLRVKVTSVIHCESFQLKLRSRECITY